jgi:hypothetical protein
MRYCKKSASQKGFKNGKRARELVKEALRETRRKEAIRLSREYTGFTCGRYAGKSFEEVYAIDPRHLYLVGGDSTAPERLTSGISTFLRNKDVVTS